MSKPSWRRHEERAKYSSVFRGYRVETQKNSSSVGKRPDFFGVSKRNPKKRIVGDAKYVKELTMEHVRQVRSYKGYPFFAQEGVIFVKKTTKIPKEVREAAKKSNIKIVRMGSRRKRRSVMERLLGI
jgi:hypothetical protein